MAYDLVPLEMNSEQRLLNDFMYSLRQKAGIESRVDAQAFVGRMYPVIDEPSFLDRLQNVHYLNDAFVTDGQRRYMAAHVLTDKRNSILDEVIEGADLEKIYDKIRQPLQLNSLGDFVRGAVIDGKTREMYADLDQIVGGSSHDMLDNMPYRSMSNVIAAVSFVGSLVSFAEAADNYFVSVYTNPDKSLLMALACTAGGAIAFSWAIRALWENVVKRPSDDHMWYVSRIREFKELYKEYIPHALKRS